MIQPFPIGSFGSLNIVADSTELGFGNATAMSNIRPDRPGTITVRDGVVKKTSTTTSATSGALNYYRAGGVFLWAHSAGFRTVSPSSFTATDNTTLTGYTGATAEMAGVILMARGVTNKMATWDGTTLTAIGGAPWASFLTIMPVESRLVAACIGGYDAASFSIKTSRVYFSDPGSATTWGSSNWVDLRPDDGEQIRGLATWANNVYVFKDSAFYVFYGSSVGSDGSPIFNYRAVDVGVGLARDSAVGVCRDGVYFVATDGIYKTTGDLPVRISQPLDSLFAGATVAALYCTRDYVMFSFDPTFAKRWYEYSIATQTSAQWDYTITIAGALPNGASETGSAKHNALVGSDFFIDSTSSLYQTSPGLGTDVGIAIPWSYTSGLGDFGTPVEKAIRWVDVTGTGSATVSWTTETNRATDGTPAPVSLTLGSSSLDTARAVGAVRGRRFSYTVTGSGATRISMVTPYVTGGEAE